MICLFSPTTHFFSSLVSSVALGGLADANSVIMNYVFLWGAEGVGVLWVVLVAFWPLGRLISHLWDGNKGYFGLVRVVWWLLHNKLNFHFSTSFYFCCFINTKFIINLNLTSSPSFSVKLKYCFGPNSNLLGLYLFFKIRYCFFSSINNIIRNINYNLI